MLIQAHASDSPFSFGDAAKVLVLSPFSIFIATLLFQALYEHKYNVEWYVTLVFVSISSIKAVVDSVMQARHEFDRNQVFYLISSALRIVWILIFTKTFKIPSTYYLFALVAFGELLFSIPWLMYLVNNLKIFKFSMPSVNILRRTFVFWISSSSRLLSSELDKLLLAGFASNNVFTSYVLLNRIFSGASIIPASYFSKSTPYIINAKFRKDVGDIEKNGLRFLGFSAFIFVFSALAYLMFTLNVNGYTLLLTISFTLLILIQYIYTAKLDYIFYRSSPFSRMYIQVVGLACLIAGFYIFTPSLGVIGLVIALFLSQLSILMSTIYIFSKDFK